MNVSSASNPSPKNRVAAPGQSTPVDLAAALRRIDDDRSLLRDLAVIFIEDAPSMIATLQSSIPSGAAAEVERAAHSLKGLAANFYADSLQCCAQRLEDAGRAADLDDANDLLNSLVREVVIVTTILQKDVLNARMTRIQTQNPHAPG